MDRKLLLDAAIRGLTGRDGVAALIAALGLDPQPRELEAEECGFLGLAAVQEVDGVVIVGERPGLLVLLIELAEPLTGARLAVLARRVRQADGLRQHLFLAADPGYHRVALLCFGLAGELHRLVIEPDSVRGTDVDALAEMVAEDGEGGLALAARYARALDRSRVTGRFFLDFRAQRSRVAAAWTGIPAGARADREQLALLLLCRLMFLCFLQRGGHLAGEDEYVSSLFRCWRRSRRRRRRSFFGRVLAQLFFGVLNTRPAARTRGARMLGDLPYLNGGLFERTAVELRYPQLDLGDDALARVFDELLDRYRFSTREAAVDLVEGDVTAGIDPEMLGRVFEGVMAADRRGDTGTFFTPAAAVDRIVTGALAAHLAARLGGDRVEFERLVREGPAVCSDAALRTGMESVLQNLRILDPACGSGAFLLGAMTRLAALRVALGHGDAATVRRDIVARSIHGVDIQADAALLCALRLWLALTVLDGDRNAGIQPLPNLDRRIRQGDALLDPLDLIGAGEAGASPESRAAGDPVVRSAAAALAPLALRYVSSEPGERAPIQQELLSREVALAEAWIRAADQRLEHRLSELRLRAAQRDLWGEPTRDALDAATRAPRIESDRAELARLAAAVHQSGALPFFSFAVHFAETAHDGFDLILTNPPWVRAHRWPATLRRLVRRRYLVCRSAGWPHGAELTRAPLAAGAQVDLALLFLEKSLRLLACGGTLGVLLPAKTLRSLYGGPARSLLLRETRISAIEDHGLDHRSMFAADSFAASVIATREAGSPAADETVDLTRRAVRVVLHRRGVDPLTFDLPQSELPLVAGDWHSPWLLAPPRAQQALRTMQRAGNVLGRVLRVRRGIFTGANDVFLIREASPLLGGLARIRAEGRFARRRPVGGRLRASDFEAILESDVLLPVLRGSGVSAWRYTTHGHVLWAYGSDARYRDPPARALAYLERHRERLGNRSGARRVAELFRVTADALGPKVVWHDLADRLNAVAVPAMVRSVFGRSSPIVPLNTVYFVPVAEQSTALVLAALLNSMPVRVFARAVAERAKDARFRFFAWTVAVVPLPPAFPGCLAGSEVLRIARRAHADEDIEPQTQQFLDEAVARAYGLSAQHVTALAEFDDWLSGRHR